MVLAYTTEDDMNSEERVKQFYTEFPNGFAGGVDVGLTVVDRHLPQRRAAMLNAMAELEKVFGPVTWTNMTFNLRETLTRYGASKQVGANQLVDGVLADGTSVQYRYYQKLYAEAGTRQYKVGKQKWQSFSSLEKETA
jgi:hypothetical protein